MGQPEEKRPPTRPYGRWNDNIKMNVKEIGWEDVPCSFKHCNDLSVSVKCVKFLDQLRTTQHGVTAHIKDHYQMFTEVLNKRLDSRCSDVANGIA
jgi:hypothetical protein